MKRGLMPPDDTGRKQVCCLQEKGNQVAEVQISCAPCMHAAFGGCRSLCTRYHSTASGRCP
jgi:hypothetical protein